MRQDFREKLDDLIMAFTKDPGISSEEMIEELERRADDERRAARRLEGE